ncbi:MAG: ABC transporter substrate-binding protein [Halobacteriaceae archaeon]
MGEHASAIRSLTRRGFLGTTSVAALAGCLSLDFGDSPHRLEFVTARPPLTLDPMAVGDAGSAHVVNQVVEGLYQYDPDLDLVPKLAMGPPEVSRSGTRYVVPIDEAATFPGGDPVEATDVVHSFTVPRTEPTPPGAAMRMIADVTAIDRQTVQFDLSYPYPAFPSVLTWYIVPSDLPSLPDTDPPEGAAARLVGSGAFEFEDRLTDGGIRLTTRSDYWDDPAPAIDGVDFRPVPEGTKRVITVKASEADVINEVPPNVWEPLKDLDAVTLASTAGLGYYYLGFNCRGGPTADPRVREAIDYAVDLDRAVTDAVAPLGDRLYAPVPRQISDAWSFPTDAWASIPHDRDIDRAATLLDDSDAVPPDWEARIIVPPDDTRHQLGEAVAAGIRAAGYRARVDRLDWATLADTYTSGDPQDYTAYVLGWIDAPDPDRYLHPLFGPQAAGRTDGTYYTGVAETVQAARETRDRATRRTRYIEAIETLLTDRAHLPLYTQPQSLGMVRTVEDIGTHPLDGFVLVGHGYNVTITAQE